MVASLRLRSSGVQGVRGANGRMGEWAMGMSAYRRGQLPDETVGTVERCLACEAVVNRGKRVAGLSFCGALQRALDFQTTVPPREALQSADYHGPSNRLSPVHHGLASEAALHGWRPLRSPRANHR